MTVEKPCTNMPNVALQRELVRRSGTMADYALFARHTSGVAPSAGGALERGW